jgi:hypothetical protein
MVSTQQNFIISTVRGQSLSNRHSPLTFPDQRRIDKRDDLLWVWGCAAISASHHAVQKGGLRR